MGFGIKDYKSLDFLWNVVIKLILWSALSRRLRHNSTLSIIKSSEWSITCQKQRDKKYCLNYFEIDLILQENKIKCLKYYAAEVHRQNKCMLQDDNQTRASLYPNILMPKIFKIPNDKKGFFTNCPTVVHLNWKWRNYIENGVGTTMFI